MREIQECIHYSGVMILQIKLFLEYEQMWKYTETFHKILWNLNAPNNFTCHITES